MTDEKDQGVPFAIAPPTDFMITQTAMLYKRYALEAKHLVGLMPVSRENRVRALCAIVHTMMTYDALAAQILGVKPVVQPIPARDEPLLP